MGISHRRSRRRIEIGMVIETDEGKEYVVTEDLTHVAMNGLPPSVAVRGSLIRNGTPLWRVSRYIDQRFKDTGKRIEPPEPRNYTD